MQTLVTLSHWERVAEGRVRVELERFGDTPHPNPLPLGNIMQLLSSGVALVFGVLR